MGDRVRLALGPRDERPPLSVLGARAQRALANLHEALPVFLGLAPLHATRQDAGAAGILGAQVFLAARVLYVPAYLFAPPGIRSVVWTVAFAALVWMGVALVRGA